MKKELREKKQKEAKDKIIEAALTTVAEHKISGTRMRSIAENAGISQGHLHYYFSSKKDLMLAILDKIIKNFSDARKKQLKNEDLTWVKKIFLFFKQKKDQIENEKLSSVLSDFCVQGTTDTDIGEKIKFSYQQWERDIRQVLEVAEKEGLISPKYSKMLPFFIISIMEGVTTQKSVNPDVIDLDEYFDTFAEMLNDLLKL